MNMKWLAIMILFITAAFSSAQEEQPVTAEPQVSAQAERPLKTQKEKVSYGIGVDAAKSFLKRGIDLDPEILTRGFMDAYSGSELLMSEDEIREALISFQNEMTQKSEEAVKALTEKNKKEGEAFLSGNKTKEGVVTLASGLQYKILKAGEGKQPTEEDIVEAHYRGTFIDGREFDSSYTRGQSAKFPLNRIIAGWKEALKLMPVGSKWQLFVPSDLAYGAEGRELIEPNAVLIFEVELLAILPSEEVKQ
jgi:FKBP-type peptidyl-prolyl cis-trans isomerase